MGRPPKPTDERRTDRLSGVRVTAAERVHIEAQAAKAGLSVADFIRACALSRRVTPRRASADDRLLGEINRIGVNLNQIAARVNMTGDLADDFRDVLAVLRQTMDRVSPNGP